MSGATMHRIGDGSGAARKPRIALMGEFSAGKSTLSNLLLGARPLPEKVTATRLSPVWLAKGDDPAYRETTDGSLEHVSLDHLEGIPVEETRVIRIFLEADILDVCDLIDFPGISDPNMSSDVWQRMLSEVDAVLWCTHATQAWRQSEAGVWSGIPEEVRKRSLLLVTRFDKLTTDRDRKRVLSRVMRETEGLFAHTFPISLTQALAAGEDDAKWEASGAAAFADHLIEMVVELAAFIEDKPESIYQWAEAGGPSQPSKPKSQVKLHRPAAMGIAPKRVEPQGERTERLSAEDASGRRNYIQAVAARSTEEGATPTEETES
ncbi:dynamin family protein [Aestuariibius sp. 2305UL40-4]|uniref:dynamin family protein n=1 Tax=Aestuariibius violaceus TaxID=3234132 RepID=UPI00345EA7B0